MVAGVGVGSGVGRQRRFCNRLLSLVLLLLSLPACARVKGLQTHPNPLTTMQAHTRSSRLHSRGHRSPAAKKDVGGMSGRVMPGSRPLNMVQEGNKLFLNVASHTVPANSNSIVCFGPVDVKDIDSTVRVFSPSADMGVLHHMILSYGDKRENCHNLHNIMWSWARTGQDRINPKSLELPDGYGFKIGAKYGRSHLFLQVHYVNRGDKDVIDQSGAILTLDDSPVKDLRIELLLRQNLNIAPDREEEALCDAFEVVAPHVDGRPSVSGDPIKIIAYRVHAHAAGIRIETHHYRNGEKLGIIASHNPQEAQLYYLTDYPHNVEIGDILVLYCFYSTMGRTWTTVLGGDDLREEMCNHYLMHTGYVRTKSLYLTLAKNRLLHSGDEGMLPPLFKRFANETCMRFP